MDGTSELTVVIVSWNVRELLARCLRSVQASLAAGGLAGRVIVVDSASTDGSAEMVRRDFPEVTLLALEENRGFAAACNAALTPTPLPGGEGVRAFLLLNADVELEPEAIPRLASYLEAHPEVGVVGPQLRSPDGTVQSSRRRFPTVGTLFWESTLLEEVFPGNPWVRRYRMQDRPDDVEQEVDWLVGACLLVRDEAVSQAGPLDEGYFLYFEELEWLQRIRRAGWRVVYLPSVRAIHYGGRSTAQVPLERHLHFQRSKVRYARATFGPAVASLLRLFLLATHGWKFLVEGAKFLLGHRRDLRRERMRVYAAILRDGLRATPA
ncbi:MAG: glycosyltransferase family 2 protein [Chloroflexia bacterium]